MGLVSEDCVVFFSGFVWYSSFFLRYWVVLVFRYIFFFSGVYLFI